MAEFSDRWNKTFTNPKPIMAMLHLGGDDRDEKLQRAMTEAKQLADGGVDAVIVENYFGDKEDVERVLAELTEHPVGVTVGLNVLRDAKRAFELAKKYPVAFIQMDSVAGHLEPEADADFAAELAQWRAGFDGLLLGGVRFKYQPVNSGRSEAEDLRIGAKRSDAIVSTGEATGIETDLEKTVRFKETLGASVPVIVGAGLTAENVIEQLSLADGAIVGSYLKDTYKDTGVVDPHHVQTFMDRVRAFRAGEIS